ncbi:MAG: hypothetical protein AB1899_06880 [Pseudomonadota bacterium]
MLAGCDQLAERAGFPDPATVEADGKAIGGACRHAGRGLEDCYRLNKSASKAAIYAGWKEMNEYMVKNNLPVVEPSITPLALDALKKKDGEAHGEGHAEKKEEAKAEEGKDKGSGKEEDKKTEAGKEDGHTKAASH